MIRTQVREAGCVIRRVEYMADHDNGFQVTVVINIVIIIIIIIMMVIIFQRRRQIPPGKNSQRTTEMTRAITITMKDT